MTSDLEKKIINYFIIYASSDLRLIFRILCQTTQLTPRNVYRRYSFIIFESIMCAIDQSGWTPQPPPPPGSSLYDPEKICKNMIITCGVYTHNRCGRVKNTIRVDSFLTFEVILQDVPSNRRPYPVLEVRIYTAAIELFV